MTKVHAHRSYWQREALFQCSYIVPAVQGDKFPKHPLMIVICPTNYLEYQLEGTLVKYGVKGLVINTDTLQAAVLR
ncbi:hypothetical protein C8J56DRAFT_1055494 [Mycena floridula]|nr:hypothetical protein C8J56DRAFT_1055494 [Mycena floridula]